MRRTLLIAIPFALTSAFLIPSTFHNPLSRFLPSSSTTNNPPTYLNQLNNQQGMNPVGPVQPPGTGDNKPSTDDNDPQSDLTISDILPLSRSINIFAQLTRDIASVTTRLSTLAVGSNTTLLAPLNSAMQDLPRKPWEDRPGDSSGVSAQHNEEKAAENLTRFVEMHIVPESPWVEGQEGKIKTVGGSEVWWEKQDGKRIVKGTGFELEVSEVLGRVGNGEVWAVKGVVNYE